MQTQAIKCAFCENPYQQGEYHPCADKTFSILNSANQVNRDPESLFKDIDNMVFQGGGVRGFGYLGIMDQLINVDKNPDIFKNLKRVAGNSAGSIIALCIGLNLEYSDIFDHLMEQDYENLLDDGVVLKIAINIDGIVGGYKYQNFKAVDIFFKGKQLLTAQIDKLKKDPKGKACDDLREIVENVIKYYGSKLGSTIIDIAKRKTLNVLSVFFADFIIKYLISLLTSDPSVQPPSLLPLFASEPQPKLKAESLLTAPSGVGESNLEERISQVVKEAYDQYRKEIIVSNEAKVPLKNGLDFYLSQLNQPFNEETEPKDALDGKILHYALAELLWFVLVSQTDATGKRISLGLFTGNKIKNELIEGAIKKKFEKLNIPYQEGFTFEQLYNSRDLDGKRLSKPFYVTAYNPLNRLTEVFSVEHTPKVVVSEAVRASMSIPVFFQPVIIHEAGLPRLVYSLDKIGEKVGEVVRYMDGGVLDNYPLYLFDDLKYCVTDDLPDWKPFKRFAIQNPRTLGFRLLRNPTILIYEQPYFDEPQQSERKKLGDDHDTNHFNFVAEALIGGVSSSENEFLKYGNCPRSVFVDNLGFSATAFDLTHQNKLDLIESGRNAVKSYRKRAQTNFKREGEKYISTVPRI